MTPIPDLEHHELAFDAQVLDAMLNRIYQIVPTSETAADPNTSEELRSECLSKIYDITFCLGRTLKLIKRSVGDMDEQIVGLIAHAKQKEVYLLN